MASDNDISLQLTSVHVLAAVAGFIDADVVVASLRASDSADVSLRSAGRDKIATGSELQQFLLSGHSRLG